MKNEEMIVLGLAALAVFFIMKGGKVIPAYKIKDYANSIGNPAINGDAAYGWQYFTDGTAISPDGKYYHNGVEVWAP
jgi:hypothetical protein